MLVTRERTIGGHQYAVTTLGAMRAFKLFPLAMRAFSTPKGVDGQQALLESFLKLKPDEIEFLTKELLSNAKVDGKPLLDVMEVLLAGESLTLIEILIFAVEVNYSGFSDAAATAPAAAEGSDSAA